MSRPHQTTWHHAQVLFRERQPETTLRQIFSKLNRKFVRQIKYQDEPQLQYYRFFGPMDAIEVFVKLGGEVSIDASVETDANVIRDWASHVNRFEDRNSVGSADLLSQRAGQKYLNLNEVNSYARNLSALFPRLAKLDCLPFKSHECRDTLVLKLGASVTRSSQNSQVSVITAGMHGREWGGPDIAVYFADRVLKAMDGREDLVFGEWRVSYNEMRNALENRTIWIVPCMNPDGFNFSQTYRPKDPFDYTGRWWRKNRNAANQSADLWWGTDPNRNFDFAWCSGNKRTGDGDYRGVSAHSEPETQNGAFLVDRIASAEVGSLIDIHNFGCQILHSWGHAPIEVVENAPPPANRFKTSACNEVGYVEPMERVVHDQISRVAGSMSSAAALASGIQYPASTAYFEADGPYSADCASGTIVDYALARPLLSGSKATTRAFTIEFGENDYQVPFASFVPHAVATCAAIGEALIMQS